MTVLKHINNTSLFFGICIAVVLLFGGVASAANYYVAPDGNDSNPGTEVQSWKTIQKAANTLTAGDTVYIKSGTYNEMVTAKNSGSPGNYITYTAYPGDTVTVDGTGVTWSWGATFLIVEKSYIKVSGLGTKNSAGFGIRATDADHIIIEKCYTYNTFESGIVAQYSNNIIIDSNEVELACNGGSQECISLYNVDTFEVKNNEVHRTGPENLGGEGIDAKRSCRNGEIHNNHVHDLTELGIYVDARGYIIDIDIHDNVIHDCTIGISLATEDGGDLENIKIYNNIAYNNDFGFAIVSYLDRAPDGSHLKKNIEVINNNFCNNGRSGMTITDEGEHFQDFTIRNNILSTEEGEQVFVFAHLVEENVNIDHNLFYGRTTIYGDDHRIGDPRFVNPNAADFHLQEDSPAIDNGSSVDAPGDDYDGNHRPQGTGYDIGAYEFGAEDNTPPTIIVHFPEGNVVDVGAAVSVTFSETMDKTSAQEAFSISPSVTGAFQWDGNKMIFTPGANLAYDTTYTVTISTDAKDLAENNLESPYSWAFTTVDGPVDSLDEDGSATEPVDAADEPDGDDGSNGGSEGCGCRTAGGKAERPATGVILMFLLFLVYLTRSSSLRPPYRGRNPRKYPE